MSIFLLVEVFNAIALSVIPPTASFQSKGEILKHFQETLAFIPRFERLKASFYSIFDHLINNLEIQRRHHRTRIRGSAVGGRERQAIPNGGF